MSLRREGIGDLYHQETKYRREAMPRGGLQWVHPPSPHKEFPYALQHFPLHPPMERGGKPIWEVMAKRRSIREFSNQPITFSELSQLVWATQGITSREWGIEFRATPSAGALYPVETYIIANRIEAIPSGLYHYHPKKALLILLKEGLLISDLQYAAMGQEMLEGAACVFIWTAMVDRSKWKYRERAYRYIYMDAGHIGQNLYLAATAMGLGCCTVGAFFDDEIDQILGIDGREEISIYLGVIGRIGQDL